MKEEHFKFFLDFLTQRAPMRIPTKNFSQFGKSVLPAIANIYINTLKDISEEFVSIDTEFNTTQTHTANQVTLQ